MEIGRVLVGIRQITIGGKRYIEIYLKPVEKEALSFVNTRKVGILDKKGKKL